MDGTKLGLFLMPMSGSHKDNKHDTQERRNETNCIVRAKAASQGSFFKNVEEGRKLLKAALNTRDPLEFG